MSTGAKHLDQLPNYVRHIFSRRAPKTHNGGPPIGPDTSTPKLNPAFACWLMGWPWWWTHPEPIKSAAPAMAWWRSKLQSRLSTLLDG